MIPEWRVTPRFLRNALLTVAMVVPTLGFAQTRFAVPDIPVTMSRYTHVEECVAAVERLSAEATAMDDTWLDTLPITQSEYLAMAQRPLAVVTFARECAAGIRAHAVDRQRPIHSAFAWIRLYLAAERYDAVDTVIQDIFNEVVHRDRNQEIGAYEQINLILFHSWPIQFSLLEKLRHQLQRRASVIGYHNLFRTSGVLLTRAKDLGDSVRIRRYIQDIRDLVDTFSIEERRSARFDSVAQRVVYHALETALGDSLLDSLHISTKAYLALKRSAWQRASGGRTLELPSTIGNVAPSLVGNYWFDTAGTIAVGARSLVGRTSLVIFLWGGCHSETYPFTGFTHHSNVGGNGACWDTYAALRRLHQEFPTLDIIIVSQTAGYIGKSRVFSVDEEANELHEFWHTIHRVPGTLTVTETRFIRLDAPDGRRIDSPVENVTNYTFGKSASIAPKTAFLVDSDGIVVHTDFLSRSTEQEFRDLIDVLMKR